jgi:cullin-4
MNAGEFLVHCTLRVGEEEGRSRNVLPESSWAAVTRTTERSLLNERLTWVAKEGAIGFIEPGEKACNNFYSAIGTLIKEKNLKNLATMYEQFARNDGLKILCAHFKAYVKASCSIEIR